MVGIDGHQQDRRMEWLSDLDIKII